MLLFHYTFKRWKQLSVSVLTLLSFGLGCALVCTSLTLCPYNYRKHIVLWFEASVDFSAAGWFDWIWLVTTVRFAWLTKKKPPELPLLKGQTHKTLYVFKQDKPLIVLPVAGHSDNLPILLIVPISGCPAQFTQMSNRLCDDGGHQP